MILYPCKRFNHLFFVKKNFMFKWILIFLIVIASPLLFENVWAFPEQWESLGAELSLYRIIHDDEAKIVSTSSVH